MTRALLRGVDLLAGARKSQAAPGLEKILKENSPRKTAEEQVMSAENETHAAVVAEMRGTDNKCQFATKDGTGCYHCPFGSAASNCLFDKFAYRAEAAHKREVEKLNSVIQATVSRSDAEIEHLRREVAELRKQIGNAAKLREAICTLRTALKEIRNDVLDMVMNHKSEDPDSYAHGLCLSIGGACDMALNSTKEFEKGGAK